MKTNVPITNKAEYIFGQPIKQVKQISVTFFPVKKKIKTTRETAFGSS